MVYRTNERAIFRQVIRQPLTDCIT
ncbi:hypothetical protein J2T58_000416 [Methanocalculus alkaliphilus]|nr:hypothetical protein [Methanocalculus alkaliphilus]